MSVEGKDDDNNEIPTKAGECYTKTSILGAEGGGGGCKWIILSLPAPIRKPELILLLVGLVYEEAPPGARRVTLLEADGSRCTPKAKHIPV